MGCFIFVMHVDVSRRSQRQKSSPLVWNLEPALADCRRLHIGGLISNESEVKRAHVNILQRYFTPCSS